MTDLLIKTLFAYLLGSVSGSMLIGRLRHVDIRKTGSGNAGGTNALRTQGFWFALGVVVIDIGKGVLAAGWIPTVSVIGSLNPDWLLLTTLSCAFAAVFGHCYPIWHGFRGGKGAATAVGTLAVIQPLALVSMILVWILTLILTGYVGLATILAAISLVPAFWLLESGQSMMVFAVVLAAFVVFMHRSNIRNMRSGSEHRFEKVRIQNWFGRP